MLTLLSPAKRLDLEATSPSDVRSEPVLLKDAELLIKRCKRLSSKKLQNLMSISVGLGDLNYDRFQEMRVGELSDYARPAVMTFAGDVYLGLDAPSLSAADLEWSQTHLGILSGLYGLLRPLDLIQPYRLEMGTRLKTRRGDNLYHYWGDRIARALNSHVADHDDATIVNLASNEYFKAVKRKKLKTRVVTPVFKELHNGKLKVISFNAKKARGLMTRWLVTNRIDEASRLTDFADERYVFAPELSTPDEPVFTREFISAVQA